MAVADTFSGFTPDSFAFFGDLARNNHKLWFDENRARYDQHVVGVFRGLLEELRPFLLDLNPHFETAGKTNGNFSRINRDIRFSNDKSPYKSNFYLYVFDGRHDRAHGGRLYVGLSADCVTAGFSIYGGDKREPDDAMQKVFRRRLLSNGESFHRLLEKVVRGRRYETYWHRMEKRDWAQHQGLPKRDEDWQTLQAWIVRKVFLPNARGLATPAFARQVQDIFTKLYPLVVFTSESSPQWQAQLKKLL